MQSFLNRSYKQIVTLGAAMLDLFFFSMTFASLMLIELFIIKMGFRD